MKKNRSKSQTDFENIEDGKIPEFLPVLSLMSSIIFPYDVLSLEIGRKLNLNIIRDEVSEGGMVALVLQKNLEKSEISPRNLAKVGVACRVIHKINLPNNSIQAVFQGLKRIEIEKIVQSEPYIKAKVKPLSSLEEKSKEVTPIIRNVLKTFEELVSMDEKYPKELINILKRNIQGPGRFADLVASYTNFSIPEKQKILEELACKQRLLRIASMLAEEIKKLKVESDIKEKVEKDLDEVQRQFLLRQQLETIKKELGEEEPGELEIRGLKSKLESLDIPSEVRDEALKEIERLSMVAPSTAEYLVIRNYIDWIIEMPWNISTKDTLHIQTAKEILDKDHYGLEKIKERIIEFLSVLKIKKDLKGPILCLSGPPGVGKTSLGKSIARAMGREFVRISVGGMRDEAEIKGHRRTYVGAMPGKIIQGIKRAGNNNPVFMIDEIDKMGADFRGDPSSAMLEVLDPEQNSSFSDYYLNIPFDLSKVFFITTANILDDIPEPLQDRMEVIEISSYTREEKLIIAKKFLLPKQLRANGLSPSDLELTEDAIKEIIISHTREAGLRNLERIIGSICRKIATHIASGEKYKKVVDVEDLEGFLGPRKFLSELAERSPEVGIATGLAWTPYGGELLFIEATKMKGRGEMIITGRLGEVMRESVQAAMSYVRSKAKELNIPPESFSDFNIHIHFPEGAIPKDGPSAGGAAAIAITSIFTERPVRHDVAMTGEITLRGKILPIGGVKEKVLAAYRAGIKKVILPSQNEKDLFDIPKGIKEKLSFSFVDNVKLIMDEVLLESPRLTTN